MHHDDFGMSLYQNQSTETNAPHSPPPPPHPHLLLLLLTVILRQLQQIVCLVVPVILQASWR
jgi:hypothetical protein